MIANSLIAARVTSDTKGHFAALAWRQGLTESALLKRLVDSALDAAGEAYDDEMGPVRPVATGTRISVRLYAEDLLLLRERATARSIPTGTYISMLVRSHLRSLTPLPSDELAALKRSIAEVGAIGRNLNQIARALNRGEHPHGPSSGDLMALLRALTGLRDHTKALISANLTSWSSGHEKARR